MRRRSGRPAREPPVPDGAGRSSSSAQSSRDRRSVVLVDRLAEVPRSRGLPRARRVGDLVGDQRTSSPWRRPRRHSRAGSTWSPSARRRPSDRAPPWATNGASNARRRPAVLVRTPVGLAAGVDRNPDAFRRRTARRLAPRRRRLGRNGRRSQPAARRPNPPSGSGRRRRGRASRRVAGARRRRPAPSRGVSSSGMPTQSRRTRRRPLGGRAGRTDGAATAQTGVGGKPGEGAGVRRHGGTGRAPGGGTGSKAAAARWAAAEGGVAAGGATAGADGSAAAARDVECGGSVAPRASMGRLRELAEGRAQPVLGVDRLLAPVSAKLAGGVPVRAVARCRAGRRPNAGGTGEPTGARPRSAGRRHRAGRNARRRRVGGHRVHAGWFHAGWFQRGGGGLRRSGSWRWIGSPTTGRPASRHPSRRRAPRARTSRATPRSDGGPPGGRRRRVAGRAGRTATGGSGGRAASRSGRRPPPSWLEQPVGVIEVARSSSARRVRSFQSQILQSDRREVGHPPASMTSRAPVPRSTTTATARPRRPRRAAPRSPSAGSRRWSRCPRGRSRACPRHPAPRPACPGRGPSAPCARRTRRTRARAHLVEDRRGRDRVGAHGHARRRRRRRDLGDEIEHDLADERGHAVVEADLAEVDVVRRLLAAGQREVAVEHRVVRDVLDESAARVGGEGCPESSPRILRSCFLSAVERVSRRTRAAQSRIAPAATGGSRGRRRRRSSQHRARPTAASTAGRSMWNSERLLRALRRTNR